MGNKRSYYWIKLNTAYLSDAKFMKLDAKDKGYYFLFYLLACEGDAGGWLIQKGESLTIDELAFILHSDSNEIAEAINNLTVAGFMSNGNDVFSISQFIDEQGPDSFQEKQSQKREEWRLRQEKSREKKKLNLDLNKDKEKEEERDKEKEKKEIREDVDKDIDKDIDIDIEVTRDKTVTEKPNNTFSLSNQNTDRGIPKTEEQITEYILNNWDDTDEHYVKCFAEQLIEEDKFNLFEKEFQGEKLNTKKLFIFWDNNFSEPPF
jgi:hypothetical protein